MIYFFKFKQLYKQSLTMSLSLSFHLSLSLSLSPAPSRTLGYKNRYVRVPDGHFWIEGDHHGHSLDSNSFGPVRHHTRSPTNHQTHSPSPRTEMLQPFEKCSSLHVACPAWLLERQTDHPNPGGRALISACVK